MNRDLDVLFEALDASVARVDQLAEGGVRVGFIADEVDERLVDALAAAVPQYLEVGKSLDGFVKAIVRATVTTLKDHGRLVGEAA